MDAVTGPNPSPLARETIDAPKLATIIGVEADWGGTEEHLPGNASGMLIGLPDRARHTRASCPGVLSRCGTGSAQPLPRTRARSKRIGTKRMSANTAGSKRARYR